MINRRKTITVVVGDVRIGSLFPIAVQSMTKVATVETSRCVRQIKQLVHAGCDLVRLAVPTRADTGAFAKIVPQVTVPLIADVHFSPARAIEAIEAGAAKVRLNPGNIKKPKDIFRIIDAAKIHKTAVRVGVNEASIRDMGRHYVPLSKRVPLMLREMKKYVRVFEKRGFDQIVLSAKSSDVLRTIEVNRQIAAAFDYPIHLGLTHAGLAEHSRVPSAVAVGTLLAEGIGDTIRISAAGNPLKETQIAVEILEALGLRRKAAPELIVCPTCARAQMDITKLARRIKRLIEDVNKPFRIAVMGCVVNGPGEAADADLAVCAAKTKAYIYRHGRRVSTVPQERILQEVQEQLRRL